MKKVLIILTVLILASCNAYKDIPVTNLDVGMTIEQVQAIVKKPLVQVSMSQDEKGEKKIFQVQKRIVRGGIARQQRYNLYFLNNKLVKYEKDSERFSF
ncbi:outer membrane protein assembly factor BamE domain-containing protein [Carboxylicivirga sp. N1Y90]|uniref:outer membrane protein assembly factor BamE domain-containing protein n=1 Tax=Carboxylicivirga fragile TaxID=3417571 RepID=UPI003D329A6F|nr:outer membrane protein assembly factor BamE [Marinilabiliaceae bacterium N1Y90]